MEESSISCRSSLSPYLSLPLHPLCFHSSTIALLTLSLSFRSIFSTLSSFPLHMWISFSLIIMIFRFSFTCRPLKPGSSSSNAPSFSSEFKQPHKMASVLQSTSCTEMLKQLLCCFCPNLTSRNSVVQQRCYHGHAE